MSGVRAGPLRDGAQGDDRREPLRRHHARRAVRLVVRGLRGERGRERRAVPALRVAFRAQDDERAVAGFARARRVRAHRLARARRARARRRGGPADGSFPRDAERGRARRARGGPREGGSRGGAESAREPSGPAGGVRRRRRGVVRVQGDRAGRDEEALRRVRFAQVVGDPLRPRVRLLRREAEGVVVPGRGVRGPRLGRIDDARRRRRGVRPGRDADALRRAARRRAAAANGAAARRRRTSRTSPRCTNTRTRRSGTARSGCVGW